MMNTMTPVHLNVVLIFLFDNCNPLFFFCSPASLPYLIEKSQASEIPEVRYCLQALTGPAQLGTQGSLVWEGDVLEMSRYAKETNFVV